METNINAQKHLTDLYHVWILTITFKSYQFCLGNNWKLEINFFSFFVYKYENKHFLFNMSEW